MFQVLLLRALPRKQDNEFNQALISGAIRSPEEMEIGGILLSFICGLLGTLAFFL